MYYIEKTQMLLKTACNSVLAAAFLLVVNNGTGNGNGNRDCSRNGGRKLERRMATWNGETGNGNGNVNGK